MKTFIQHILERRSNPELNPKTSINQIIKDAVATNNSKIAGVQNLFISMTKAMDTKHEIGYEFGINLKSGYNTPWGIYSYPAKFVYDTVGDNKSLSALPYVGEPEKSPFVNIFSAKGDIINLHTMNQGELDKYVSKIGSILSKRRKPVSLDQIVRNSFRKATVKTTGGRFWYITMKCAEYIDEENVPLGWNRLFTLCGINGCVDPAGEGIIHPNEPTQAVFFSTKAVAKNTRYSNKYSPEQTSTSMLKKFIHMGQDRMTDDELIAIIKDNPLHSIGNAADKIDVSKLSQKVLLTILKIPELPVKGMINSEDFSSKQLTPAVLKTLIETQNVVILGLIELSPIYKNIVKPDMIKLAAKITLDTYSDNTPSTMWYKKNSKVQYGDFWYLKKYYAKFFRMVQDVDPELFKKLTEKFPNTYNQTLKEIVPR